MPPTIQTYMTSAPHSISRGTTLAAAQAKMKEFAVRHLPVVDGVKLVGVLSSRDLFMLDALQDRAVQLMKVEDVMSDEPYSVPPEATLAEVSSEMAKRRIGSAVVMSAGRIVGVFTTTDALEALAKFAR